MHWTTKGDIANHNGILRTFVPAISLPALP